VKCNTKCFDIKLLAVWGAEHRALEFLCMISDLFRVLHLRDMMIVKVDLSSSICAQTQVLDPGSFGFLTFFHPPHREAHERLLHFQFSLHSTHAGPIARRKTCNMRSTAAARKERNVHYKIATNRGKR